MAERKRASVYWFALSMLVLLVVWELGCRLFAVPAFILPPPSAVLATLWDLRDLLLGKHLLVTLKEVAIGLAVTIVFGVGLAVAMDFSPTLTRMIYPYIVISQTIPIIALSPIFILWFSYGLSGKIAVTVLFTFFPIVVSTFDGLRSSDPEMVNLLRTMGATRWQIFVKLKLPAALPSFFSGLKVAATYSVSGATIGEWLGASEGLGYFGRRAAGNFQAPALFASVLLLSLAGIVLFSLAGLAEKRFVNRRANRHGQSVTQKRGNLS